MVLILLTGWWNHYQYLASLLTTRLIQTVCVCCDAGWGLLERLEGKGVVGSLSRLGTLALVASLVQFFSYSLDVIWFVGVFVCMCLAIVVGKYFYLFHLKLFRSHFILSTDYTIQKSISISFINIHNRF